MQRSFPLLWLAAVSGVSFAIAAGGAGCGGVDVPLHNGYKSEKVKPWKKPKAIPLNDKFEGKATGQLSYRERKRAKWYSVDLPAGGDLAVAMEITPPADADEFDLAFEVLDPANNVMVKADSEEDDAKETSKKRNVEVPAAGRYFVHVYLQNRLDSAEYEMALQFSPRAGELKTDFPAQVAFVGDLATVPASDDTPVDRKPKERVVVKGRRPPPKPKDPVVAPKPQVDKLWGTVLKVNVSGSGTEVTFSRAAGVEAGMSATITTVRSGGSFKIASCGDRTCKGVVGATPDQIGAGKVMISP